MKSVLVFAMLVVPAPLAAEEEASLTVQISNLKTSSGQIRCALFRSAAGFPREPDRAAARVVGTIEGRTAQCHFSNIPAGRVAITAFHDENNNGKVDLRFGLIPKEGIGWSRNPRVSMRAPKFEEAAFEYSGAATRIAVRLNQR
ncbi:MAG: DUF2141 domain-containing protein [Sphingomonadales bacterium]|nr:DUF2141 domain-containing protein [Sphingomonadaceae bacterium]MBS3930082.1 DUF2141 domain-containing protein [Sphingomonadales bacterium]